MKNEARIGLFLKRQGTLFRQEGWRRAIPTDERLRFSVTDPEKTQFCMMAALGIAVVTVIATYAWLGV
jgi:hypothetical protein